MVSSQVSMWVLFGLPGLIIATPLVVCLVVWIQMLYVNDVLEENVTPLGEN